MNKKSQKLTHQDYFVFVGTYTSGNSEGIYICRLEISTGQLRHVGIARGVDNPSYLAIDAERNRLYTVNEVAEFGNRPGGGVSAFSIHPLSGELSPINQQHSYGGAPCYLTIDRSGRFLLVANYVGGNVAVIPVDRDGFLGEAIDIKTHLGRGLHPKRQERPHPHSIVLDSANEYAFVPDLGLDKVMQYRFDHEKCRLTANQRPWIKVEPGSGPRHLVFHPNNRRAFIINELNSTITAHNYDANLGTLTLYQSVPTIPDGYSGLNLAADLHISPDGNYLFGSNRGHDSIACYKIDKDTGWLTPIDIVSTQGKTPRGFAIDPTGTFLLVANQDSDSVVTFWIDTDQGRIQPTGHSAHIPSPVCLSLIA